MDWIDRANVKIKRNKIKQKDIAKKYGCRREHINLILNRRLPSPKGAKEKIETAIDEIIASKG